MQEELDSYPRLYRNNFSNFYFQEHWSLNVDLQEYWSSAWLSVLVRQGTCVWCNTFNEVRGISLSMKLIEDNARKKARYQTQNTAARTQIRD